MRYNSTKVIWPYPIPPGAVERKHVFREVSSKVAAQLFVLEAINISVEGGGDSNRYSDDADQLHYS